jgi:hypothetical protein
LYFCNVVNFVYYLDPCQIHSYPQKTKQNKTIYYNIFIYFSLQVKAKHERSLLIIFTCISATFIICHAPRMFLNIYEFKMDEDKEKCDLESGKNDPLTFMPLGPVLWVLYRLRPFLENIFLKIFLKKNNFLEKFSQNSRKKNRNSN